MEEREKKIRARAHALWEEQGRPHGRHDEHWLQAETEIGAGADADQSADGLPAPDISAITEEQHEPSPLEPPVSESTTSLSLGTEPTEPITAAEPAPDVAETTGLEPAAPEASALDQTAPTKARKAKSGTSGSKRSTAPLGGRRS